MARSRRQVALFPASWFYPVALVPRTWGVVFRPEDLANLGLAFPAWPLLFVKFHEIHRRFDCLLPRFELKNCKSADNFLGLRERPIDRGQFSPRKANTRAHRGRGE